MEMDLDDRDMSCVASGCQESFERIVGRHREKLVGWLKRQCRSQSNDAEDLAQEVFWGVYRHAGRYSANGKFDSWLFSIARRKLIDHVRRSKRSKIGRIVLFSEVEFIDVSCDAEEPSEDLARQELLARVNKILDTIPKDQSDAIRCYVEGASHSELAKAGGTCRRTITSRVRLAREKVLAEVTGSSKRPVEAK